MIKEKVIKKTKEKINSEYHEIKPPSGSITFNFKEILQHKDLLYILIWRNIKVRYKQTFIGIGWVICQPLFSMIIFSIFFGKLAKLPSDDIPYPIFIYPALIFWNYFNAALFGANGSLIDSQHILKKIYFPRLIIPLATTVTPLIDFVLGFIIFFGLMIFYRVTPHLAGIIMTPVLLLICFMSATGLGLFLTSLNVRYRDIQYILSFAIQIIFYATPIIYPVSLIPEAFRWIIYCNPMAGVIVLIRSFLLGTSTPDWLLLGTSFGISLILLIFGLWYFRKSENYFVDEL